MADSWRSISKLAEIVLETRDFPGVPRDRKHNKTEER